MKSTILLMFLALTVSSSAFAQTRVTAKSWSQREINAAIEAVNSTLRVTKVARIATADQSTQYKVELDDNGECQARVITVRQFNDEGTSFPQFTGAETGRAFCTPE